MWCLNWLNVFIGFRKCRKYDSKKIKIPNRAR